MLLFMMPHWVLAEKLDAHFIGFQYAAINIEGVVTDADGEPLVGVNIQVKGTDQGTSTDFDGRFSLDDISEDAVLILS